MRVNLSDSNGSCCFIASLAVASFAVGGIVYAVSDSQAAEIDAMSTRITRLDTLAHDLSAQIAESESALSDYASSGNAFARTRFDEEVERKSAIADQHRTTAAGLDSVLGSLERLVAASSQWRERIAGPLLRAVQAADTEAIDAFRLTEERDREAIDGALGSVARELARQHDAIDLRSDEVDGTTLIGVVIGFGFMTLAFGIALVAVRRFGHALERDARDASVLNRFTEVTSFADEDREVAAANLIALSRLTGPDASVTHILNRYDGPCRPGGHDGRRDRHDPAAPRAEPLRRHPARHDVRVGRPWRRAERPLPDLSDGDRHAGLHPADQREIRGRGPPVLEAAERAAAGTTLQHRPHHGARGVGGRQPTAAGRAPWSGQHGRKDRVGE